MKRLTVFLLVFSMLFVATSCRKSKEKAAGIVVVVNYNSYKSDSVDADSMENNSGVIFLDLEHNIEADSFRISGFMLSSAVYSSYYDGFGYLDMNNVYHITDLKGNDKLTMQMPYGIALVQADDKGHLFAVSDFQSGNKFLIINPETQTIDEKNSFDNTSAFLLCSSFYDVRDTAYFVEVQTGMDSCLYKGIDPNTGEIKYSYNVEGLFSNVVYDPSTGQAVGYYVDTTGEIFFTRFEPTTGEILTKVTPEIPMVSNCQRSFDTDRGYYIAVSMLTSEDNNFQDVIFFLSPETGKVMDTIILEHQIVQLVYKPKG